MIFCKILVYLCPEQYARVLTMSQTMVYTFWTLFFFFPFSPKSTSLLSHLLVHLFHSSCLAATTRYNLTISHLCVATNFPVSALGFRPKAGRDACGTIQINVCKPPSASKSTPHGANTAQQRKGDLLGIHPSSTSW